jgi:hypothetical protein
MSKFSVGLSLPAPVQAKLAFARVDPFSGLVAHSPEVLGMANCLDSPSQSPRPFGAYCFKLNFTPVSVIANAIAHPNDNEFGPILYTAGPNVTGEFTKDKNGRGVECPAGFALPASEDVTAVTNLLFDIP